MSFILAITQRVVENASYAETRDALSHDWIKYLGVVMPEATLVPVPNLLIDVAGWARELGINGVLLSNGNDWGEYPQRDNTEKQLFRYSVDNMLPVLGACRGLQALNVLLGGKIVTDIQSVAGRSHVAVSHPVTITDDCFSLIGDGRTLSVNSYHNQGVTLENLANDCVPFAVAEGNIIEGFYHKSLPVLAIQWHPERENEASDFDRNIIRKLFFEGRFWQV